MKIQVQNLGALQKAEFDLKPLTIIIGPNNAGKTWLAYLMAGIFGSYGWRKYTRMYIEKEIAHYPPLDEVIKSVQQKGIATIDMHTFAEKYADTYFTNVAKLAQNWMGDFMATNPVHFSNLQVLVQLAESKEAFLQRIDQFPWHIDIARGSLTFRKRANSRKLRIYTKTGESHTTYELSADDPPAGKLSFSEEDLREEVVEDAMLIFQRSLYPRVYIFPTERTTFITMPFSRMATETPTPMNTSHEVKGSWPIGRFLSMMVSIYELDESDRARREKDAANDTRIKRYIQLAELLETEILEGELYLATPETNPIREIEFHLQEDIKLGISVASSMVKELAPLVLYLRYLALPGDLLIIDEPEMNLHPAAQVKIIEFLALLIDAGLHVLVTTHSPYVVDQLSNLMEASTYTNKEKLVKKFFLERAESFISPEKVAVYEVDNGELKNILGQDGSIDWGTFSDVTNIVERIHFELIDEREEESGA